MIIDQKSKENAPAQFFAIGPGAECWVEGGIVESSLRPVG